MKPCECWYDCKYYENGWCWMESETVKSLTTKSEDCEYYDDTTDEDE